MAVAAALFAFVAVGLAAFALLTRPAAAPADARVRSLAHGPGDTDVGEARAFLRRRRALLPAFRGTFSESAWARSTARALQQANIRLRVIEYVLLRVVLAAGCLAVLVAFLPNVVGVLIGLVAAAIGYALPGVYVQAARRSRISKIEKQLVELLPSLASSLRSGFAIEQGIEAAAEQLGPPLTEELTLLLNDVRLGATMDDALRSLGERAGSTDLDIAITAVLVQRTSGGNLAEVLDQAAETLRERERIRGDIQTFTAQQRLTGAVLAVYPIVVGLALLALMPAVWSKLFTEPVGQMLLAIALALQVLGFVVIRRSLQIAV